ncbi:BRO family, N-terminal domain [Pedobacter nyackensis]|uniref:BRO family, N-terminal domain n=2 Tax=Pedobacter nyackensis TaxID=475255 RepID=A0A1W2AJW2_9SPHI|nr:BRO family, N-terminal domain [Pedobacter nyackensis]
MWIRDLKLLNLALNLYKMDIKLFESKRIRSEWSETDQKWYFSIIDVVEVLTESPRPRKYWNALKTKLKDEGSELSQFLGQLKMKAEDGKMRETDVADTKQLLRLIQSIPSPKAEPFKMWLAKVGYERMQEISDPEQSLDRARENWQKAGRSEKWIQQRMSGQETRNKLTDYWQEHGVQKGDEFALLTNIIHQEWTGMTVKTHKDIKGLERQNLRDHMTEAELLFTALAELSTRQIAESDEAEGLKENAIAGKKDGKIAKDARLALEAKTGKKVISEDSFLPAAKPKLR